MTVEQSLAIEQVQTYPKRSAYFAMKFIRILSKTCAAQDLGSTGFILLTVIVTTEDAAGYRRPVTYFDGQLLPIVGVDSQKSLALARRRCVEAGWLHYEAGGKGRAARYWVMVPDYASGLADNPTDEGDQVARQMTRKIYDESGDESGINRERIGNKPTGQRATILPIPIPIPNTNTETRFQESGECELSEPESGNPKRKCGAARKPSFDPSTVTIPDVLDEPAFREAWTEWIDHRRERRNPMTERSAKKLLSQLETMGPARAAAAIDHSIANGWTGIYEPTTNGTNYGSRTAKRTTGRHDPARPVAETL